MDYAAATPTDPKILGMMLPYWVDNFGNPSSIHREGMITSEAVSGARKKVADLLDARHEEVIFTGSGTESDNLAILGIANASIDFLKSINQTGHIITTKIEHHAVLKPVEFLESKGFEVTYVDVDKNGVVDPEEIKRALREDTVLVSVMYANNEIGTIQPIADIAKIIRKFRKEKKSRYPYLHTDACQVAGYLPLNTQKLGVDMMTLSGAKIYCSKGVGVLFLRAGTVIEPVVYGGEHEFGKRAGTENVPYIVGFAEALSLAEKNREKEVDRLIKLRDYFINSLLVRFPNCHINGDSNIRLPNNINVSFPGIEGEHLVVELDAMGISTSTGSACTSEKTGLSHVLSALGLSEDIVSGAIRFSLGRFTTKKDIEYVLNILPEIIKRNSL